MSEQHENESRAVRARIGGRARKREGGVVGVRHPRSVHPRTAIQCSMRNCYGSSVTKHAVQLLCSRNHNNIRVLTHNQPTRARSAGLSAGQVDLHPLTPAAAAAGEGDDGTE
jgi:hypothetical protein